MGKGSCGSGLGHVGLGRPRVGFKLSLFHDHDQGYSN